MVGLYKDPKGETVSTFATSGQNDEAEQTKSGGDMENELKKLRCRVIELETTIKSHVSSSSQLGGYHGLAISEQLSFECVF